MNRAAVAAAPCPGSYRAKRSSVVTDRTPGPELVTERRAWIVSGLRRSGFLTVNDLAQELGVSHMTVRRDLHVLEESGEVKLVHGGVSLPIPDGDADADDAGRAWLAARAAAIVGPADTIAIDAGATALAVARALPAGFRGSVITHSMPVLQLFDEGTMPGTAVGLGGELLPDRHAFVGPSAEAALQHLRARTFFFSPVAIDARGLYARTPAEASLQRRLIEIADQVVVVATHEVYRESAPVRITRLDRVMMFLSDQPPPRETAAALRHAKIVTPDDRPAEPFPRTLTS